MRRLGQSRRRMRVLAIAMGGVVGEGVVVRQEATRRADADARAAVIVEGVAVKEAALLRPDADAVAWIVIQDIVDDDVSDPNGRIDGDPCYCNAGPNTCTEAARTVIGGHVVLNAIALRRRADEHRARYALGPHDPVERIPGRG